MKKFKTIKEEIHPCAKILLRWGPALATFLLIFAFFSASYGIMICQTSVYLFAESIISALLIDVIDKRRR